MCHLVLNAAFNSTFINIDGKGDGGNDIAALDDMGKRVDSAYQITTQKSDIRNKAYKDAKKAIEKHKIDKFYYMASYVLEPVSERIIEQEISESLGITSYCFGVSMLSGIILEKDLVDRVISIVSKTNSLCQSSTSKNLGYREKALFSYTMLSDDAKDMKNGIYDDTILQIISDETEIVEDAIIANVKKNLAIDDTKDYQLKHRINALFGKNRIRRLTDGSITLTDQTKRSIEQRKALYEYELSSMVAAQTALLQEEYNIVWTEEESKKIAIWIAEYNIQEQIQNLTEIKVDVGAHPILATKNDGKKKIIEYFVKNKRLSREDSSKIALELFELAANNALITKISRAAIYIALEGGNLTSKAKALGLNNWSEANIIIEPTVAIPKICSHLYEGPVNRSIMAGISSVNRAKDLKANLYIPYFYINECAGHLLRARKYCDLQLNENELQFSNNAFVANYYSLKLNNKRIPDSFLEYLSTFSSAIKTEQANIKEWVRSLMTDIQSILEKEGIRYLEMPKYEADDCVDIENEYSAIIDKYKIEKASHLLRHDIWALKFMNDKAQINNEHWMLLTYDKSILSFNDNGNFHGWIFKPIKFLDLTQVYKPLSEAHFESLLHSMASYSERTLSAGARIIDKIVNYVSVEDMQNWEFRKDFELYRLRRR